MQAARNQRIEALFETLAGFEGQLGAQLMELEVGPAMRRMPGREAFLVDLADPTAPVALAVDGDAAGQTLDARSPAVVKRFAGSDGAEARAELLRGRFPRSPAKREAENLMALANLGLAVPQVVYFCEAGERSLVVLEYVPHVRHLRHGRTLAPAQLEALAQFTSTLHAAGWYHRDLYLNHVLEAHDGELVVIDLGRARHQRRPRQRWFQKDLAALAASSAIDLDGPADRQGLRFVARYFQLLERANRQAETALRPPATRRAKRRFLKAVLRRARHMRRHTPRFDHTPA